jgi:MFS family permease
MFGADAFQTGIIFSASGLGGVLFNFLAGRLADKWGRKPVIAIGSTSSRFALLGLPFTADLLQATGLMTFQSLGINVAMPATRALTADLVPPKIRGKLFGRFTALFDIGMITGALLGPWLFAAFFVGLPFFVSGIIGLIALALLLVFVKEPQREEKKLIMR